MNLKEPILVLANGAYPTHETPLSLLKKAESIVCLDGAANNLTKNNIKPDLIIGDLDSIIPDYKKQHSEIIIHDGRQDENDLRKALFWLDQNNYKKITILGATGKRDDHTIANIFSILEINLNLDIRIVTDYGIFQIIENEDEISSFKGQQVSLFTLSSNTKITTRNLKYELNSKSFKNLYSGTLNESIKNIFYIKSDDGKTLLYTTHK